MRRLKKQNETENQKVEKTKKLKNRVIRISKDIVEVRFENTFFAARDFPNSIWQN